ncbi:MAG: transaldolase family protein, partial [Armatimonadota bacterium]|nr:transaldolase family protein [Armatimonadota bacterium]
MKLFLEATDVEEIQQGVCWGVVDGVLARYAEKARQGVDYRAALVRVCDLVDGPVCAALTASSVEGILDEGRAMARWHPALVALLSLDVAALQAARVLRHEGMRVGMGPLFSANQALLAAKAGADYLVIGVGALDDAGHDGMEVVRDTVEIVDRYGLNSEVVAGDLRHPQHVTQAALAAAHIAALPFRVLTAMLRHPLTDRESPELPYGEQTPR